MIHKRVSLPVNYRNKGVKNNDFSPYLTTYIIENQDEFSKNRKRPLVLICPGGGYKMLSQREAESVAIRMNSLGFHACVLWYSVAPMTFPAALLDLAEAVNYLRTKASELNIDQNKILVCGFSAGGHLAASLGVYWDKSLIQKYLPYSAEQIKPNGLVLCYPVITTGNFAHQGSIDNVLGENSNFTEKDVCIDKLVTKNVPPVFLWHTYEDTTVPVENSLFMAIALRKASVPVELHLFRRGIHGLSLASYETYGSQEGQIQSECQIWPDLFANWAASL
ncbi:MAG: alpha/beta hydrolase [Spirochaetaceae bacterium]|nr:alpha/beta hydrolase [Spirochaetaceae bacterium]